MKASNCLLQHYCNVTVVIYVYFKQCNYSQPEKLSKIYILQYYQEYITTDNCNYNAYFA